MYYDLLVHVDLADDSRFAMAISNLKNYLAALSTENFRVIMLANGAATKHFVLGQGLLLDEIEALADQGVSFQVCANALKKAKLSSQNILPCCTIVPAGMVELVRLQREGFAYVKP